MKCSKCGKAASFHYTKNIGGQVSEYHLCSDCAKEEGFIDSFPLDFGGLFSELLGTNFIPSPTAKSCPVCSNTLGTFQKTGRMGCSACYHTFFDEISPVLKRLHGSTVHTGKLPKEVQGEIKARRQIDRLRHELHEAIQKEDFEQAAKLRDQIREMEGLS